MPTSIKHQFFFEANYGDSKNELQIMIAKRPQIEKSAPDPRPCACGYVYLLMHEILTYFDKAIPTVLLIYHICLRYRHI